MTPIPGSINNGTLHVATNHIWTKYTRNDHFRLSGLDVKISDGPNDLFVMYTYTNVKNLKKIIYYVNDERKEFNGFCRKTQERSPEEVIIYFCKYNDTPLFMSIILEDQKSQLKGQNKTQQQPSRLNYSLKNNGEWEESSSFLHIFSELRAQSYKFNLLEFFEIDRDDNYNQILNGLDSYPSYEISKVITNGFKIYKHKFKLDRPLAKFFTYRKRLLKNIIISEQSFKEVEVYYNEIDHKNNLPLMIVVDELGTKKYFENKGGNYNWDKAKDRALYYNDNLMKKLNKLNETLVGRAIKIDLEEVIDKYKNEEYYKDNVVIRKRYIKKVQYTEYKYFDRNHKRFSISEIKSSDFEHLEFPDCPLYSVLEFYAFHHDSWDIPLFLCAVYENKENHIFDWYKLTNIQRGKYEPAYAFSQDPTKFHEFKPILNIMESDLYKLDFEIGANLAKSTRVKDLGLENIGGHSFDIVRHRVYTDHFKYQIKPTSSNHFSIKSLTIYGDEIEDFKLEMVGEVYVFESNHHHLMKVCFVTTGYDYTAGQEFKKPIWYDFRKGTNVSPKWTLMNIPQTGSHPQAINNQRLINGLMREDVKGDFKYKYEDIYYKPYKNQPPGLKTRGYWRPDQLNITPTEMGYTDTIDLESASEVSTTEIEGGKGSLTGGLIGGGAGVGLATVGGGYLIYSNYPEIVNAFRGILR